MRICFVCLGNICRSPAAAAIFAQRATAAGIVVTVESAGTGSYHLGEPAHTNTAVEARRRGIPIDHRARQFSAADFDRFDLVVAMDGANRRDLRRLAPDDAARAKVVMLRAGDVDVPDPWGLPPSAYREMFDVLDEACGTLVERVQVSALPPELIDGLGVTAVHPVSGGDIAKAYRLDTRGGPLFAKTHPDPRPAMFEREAAGLRALRVAGAVAVPDVVRARSSGLVLEWIDVGGRTAASEADLGVRLAALHQVTGPHFGGLDGAPDGYLGSQPVDLTPTTDWAEFFVERRLRPLARRAVELDRLDPGALAEVERIAPHAAERCGPQEPPALLHGDLWGGNRLVDAGGANWLIDPAAYWGHREIDLAMMRLFGGFGDAAYAAYDEAFPLADGWRDRVGWYQLPPLLVHAILFGGSYGRTAMVVLVRS